MSTSSAILLTPDELRTLCLLQLQRVPSVQAIFTALDTVGYLHVYALVPMGVLGASTARIDPVLGNAELRDAERRIIASMDPGQRLALHVRERIYPELPMERAVPVGAQVYWVRPEKERTVTLSYPCKTCGLYRINSPYEAVPHDSRCQCTP